MTVEQIKKILLEKCGYSEYSAGLTANRIFNMDKECLSAFILWDTTGEIENLECGDYSVEKLIKEHELKIPAAFLAISDLKSNYEYVSQILEKGIK